MISDSVDDDVRPIAVGATKLRRRALQSPLIDDKRPHGGIPGKEECNHHFDPCATSCKKLDVNVGEKTAESHLRQKSVTKGSRTRVTVGMRLKRWIITSRIGAGSFGETFTAVEDTTGLDSKAYEHVSGDVMTASQMALALPTGLEVCIKVEQENKNVLRIETAALKRMQSCPQVARYLGSGSTRGMNFLVMQKLGPNLTELRRKTPLGTFSAFTTLKAGISCLKAIQGVHALGLVHRDIKPSNVVIGVGGDSDPRVCYLIDFGLARRYRRLNGELRPPRENAGFRGTSRYASLASHRQQELGRVDDIWSLLFMLIEFATGTLPWRKYKEKEEIGRCKEEVIGTGLVQSLPREFRPFLAHLQTLRYEDEPNYDFLLELMEQALRRRGYPPNKRLDWEQEEDAEVNEDSRGHANSVRSPVVQDDAAGDQDHDNLRNRLPLRFVLDRYAHLKPSERHVASSSKDVGIGLSGPLLSAQLGQQLAQSEWDEKKKSPISVNDVSISARIFKEESHLDDDVRELPDEPLAQGNDFPPPEDKPAYAEKMNYPVEAQKERLLSNRSENADVGGTFSSREGKRFGHHGLPNSEVAAPSPVASINRVEQQTSRLTPSDREQEGKATKKGPSFESDAKAIKTEEWDSKRKSTKSRDTCVCKCNAM